LIFQGLSIEPEEGSALFWFNLDSGGFLDTRNFHLGCPGVQHLYQKIKIFIRFSLVLKIVLYGNKWIANKWVHWLAQMHEYPCFVKTKAFPIYNN